MDANACWALLARGGALHRRDDLDEYRKYIEKDPALERRFRSCWWRSPRGGHHFHPARQKNGLRCTTACASRLLRGGGGAVQPVHHRPSASDKAIDPIDEAAAMIRTEIVAAHELDEANRKVMRLEIEREALRKETDDASRERLEKLEENELATFR